MEQEALTELLQNAIDEQGNNAPRVADALLEVIWPDTADAAMDEGAYAALRQGLIKTLRPMVRDVPSNWSGLRSNLLPYIEGLKSGSYFDPSAREYVAVPDLVDDVERLEAATLFLER